MTYPKATDYVAAVQDETALLAPDLARASFRLHPVLQIPFPASGNSAVVFQATIDGRPHALRFFIRDDASSRGRYHTLHKFVDQEHLSDCTATAQWVDEAIRVNGHRWPMVKMEWIDGRALDAYVDSLVQDQNRQALQGLATAWLELVRRMQGVRFAHGDLQHGNVLVDTQSRLRLVDFDGCWTPDSVGPSPTETGHPNYQLSGRPWGQWMDTFPGLLVYTALCGLAREPGLWKTYGARENILFTKDDFSRPFETPVWSDLRALGDSGITHGLTQLSAACGTGTGLTLPLEAVVDGQTDRPRSTYTSGPLRATPWWEKTGWTPAQGSGGESGHRTGSQPTPPRPTQGPPTNLPPPPPTTQPRVDPRFSAAHGGPWHGQPTGQTTGGEGSTGAPNRSGGSGRSGGGTYLRGASSGGAGSSGGPGGPHVPVPPPPPPHIKKKTRWWPVVIVIAIILLLITIAGCLSESSYDYTTTPGTSTSDINDTVSSSPSSIDPTTSASTEPTTAADLLRAHVPAPLSEVCTEVRPPEGNSATTGLSCCDSTESITVYCYAFGTTTELSDTYEDLYSTQESGSFQDGGRARGASPPTASGWVTTAATGRMTTTC